MSVFLALFLFCIGFVVAMLLMKLSEVDHIPIYIRDRSFGMWRIKTLAEQQEAEQEPLKTETQLVISDPLAKIVALIPDLPNLYFEYKDREAKANREFLREQAKINREFLQEQAKIDREYLQDTARANRSLLWLLLPFGVFVIAVLGALTWANKISYDALLVMTGSIVGYLFTFGTKSISFTKKSKDEHK